MRSKRAPDRTTALESVFSPLLPRYQADTFLLALCREIAKRLIPEPRIHLDQSRSLISHARIDETVTQHDVTVLLSAGMIISCTCCAREAPSATLQPAHSSLYSRWKSRIPANLITDRRASRLSGNIPDSRLTKSVSKSSEAAWTCRIHRDLRM